MSIGSSSFRYMSTGYSAGIYKTVVQSNKLYVVGKVGKVNKVRPYEIVSYEFSYMDKNNKYTAITCTGNEIDNRIYDLLSQIEKFNSIYIDKVYAKDLQKNGEVRIGGLTLLKE